MSAGGGGEWMKKFCFFTILISALNVIAAPGTGNGTMPEEKAPVMEFRMLEKHAVKEAFRQEPSSEFRFDTSVTAAVLPSAAATAAEEPQWSERISLSINAFSGLYCDGNFSADAESQHQFFSTFLLSETGKEELTFTGAPDFKLLHNPTGITKITLSRTGIYFQTIGIGAANFRARLADGANDPEGDGFGPPTDTPPEFDGALNGNGYVFELVVYFEPIPAVINDRLTLFVPGKPVQTLARIEVRFRRQQ